MTRIPNCSYFVFALAAYFLGCKVDHGLTVDDPTERIQHGITGRVTFSGAWPSNVAEARLVVTSTFPPDPTQPLGAFIFSDPIQVGTAALEYGLNLNPATYQIIAVIFRETGKAWDIGNILAVFSPLSPCTIIPDIDNSVMIESNTSVVGGVDIAVDLAKGNVSGEVQFSGTRPADIAFAGILAFESPLNLFDPIPCGLAILPLDAEVANYKVLVPANDYLIIAVAGSDLSDLTNFRTIGAYTRSGSNLPAVVAVGEAQQVANIDLQLEWPSAVQ